MNCFLQLHLINLQTGKEQNSAKLLTNAICEYTSSTKIANRKCIWMLNHFNSQKLVKYSLSEQYELQRKMFELILHHLWLIRHSHTDLIKGNHDRKVASGLQSLELGERQSMELCDNIGRMLA